MSMVSIESVSDSSVPGLTYQSLDLSELTPLSNSLQPLYLLTHALDALAP